MIEIDINSLRDNAPVEAVQAEIAAATARLAAARQATVEAVATHAIALASAKSAIIDAAAGADIDAEGRAAAVTAAAGRIALRAELADACEVALDEAQQKLRWAHHEANMPVAARGRELRLAAAIAADRARADLANADLLFQQGTSLVMAAHAGGLLGTPPAPTGVQMPAAPPGPQAAGNPVWSEAAELASREKKNG